MKHLIIGAGNMGRRHGAILKDLGDTVEYVDIEFKPNEHIFNHDSVLVCTPQETHLDIIQQLPNIPVFCEKPFFPGFNLDRFPHDRITMVACNWRWCECFNRTDDLDIILSYRTNSKAAFYDLVHFIDLFWEQFGEPKRSKHFHETKTNTQTLLMANDRAYWYVRINYDDRGEAIINGKPIHTPLTNHDELPFKSINCLMFLQQMQHWRTCVGAHVQSGNPFPQAQERTNWLSRHIMPFIQA